jgi:hypothetical protein
MVDFYAELTHFEYKMATENAISDTYKDRVDDFEEFESKYEWDELLEWMATHPEGY